MLKEAFILSYFMLDVQTALVKQKKCILLKICMLFFEQRHNSFRL